MALTLRAAISANDTVFDVTGTDALNPGDLKTIGSETIEIRTANQATAGYGETAYYRVSANRGSLGTTRASHAAASALTTTTFGGGGPVTKAAYIPPESATPEAIVLGQIEAEQMEDAP